MAASFKDFSALKSLQQDLKLKDAARQREQVEAAQRAADARLEAELFQRSIGQVKPLAPSGKATAPPPRAEPVAKQREADEQAALRESLSDEFNVDTLLETDDTLSYARPGIGADVVRRLRRGQWVIQSQLDLHGMRRDEARDALGEFLRNATRRGVRCVRVIHGKGLGSVNREPVLKSKVRSWLVQKEEVIAFCQARPADGGSGALVVLLQA